MLESGWVSLAVSTAFGFLAGLGVGGGSLLIIWLTQVLSMSHPQARIINLLFFLPAAVIATLFRKKEFSFANFRGSSADLPRFSRGFPAVFRGFPRSSVGAQAPSLTQKGA